MTEVTSAQVMAWLEDYVARPHPQLGRSGIVCPYMARALREHYVQVVDFDAARGEQELAELARDLFARIRERAAGLGSDGVHLVNLVRPYGQPVPQLRALVAAVHARLKPEFVAGGYMIGDFWPDHETVGLHNDDFRPFTSPTPLLGMRQIVPADVEFFVKHERTPADRVRYLEILVSLFEGRTTPHWAARLDQALATARQELAAPAPRPVPAG